MDLFGSLACLPCLPTPIASVAQDAEIALGAPRRVPRGRLGAARMAQRRLLQSLGACRPPLGATVRGCRNRQSFRANLGRPLGRIRPCWAKLEHSSAPLGQLGPEVHQSRPYQLRVEFDYIRAENSTHSVEAALAQLPPDQRPTRNRADVVNTLCNGFWPEMDRLGDDQVEERGLLGWEACLMRLAEHPL